jgi:transposase
MISMNEFKRIVQLRNGGKTQAEIAAELGVTERTVRNYLKNGRIPVYERTAPTRSDPLTADQLELARGILCQCPKVRSLTVFNRLRNAGYQGSYRTLCRRLKLIRQTQNPGPIFFQREHLPGDVMEGDFTDVGGVSIGGDQVTVHIWVVRLLYSGKIAATAFFNTNWECFLDGSVKAFESFGGLAQRYRLDNLSPVVKLLNKQRHLSARFVHLQKHYGFKADFCNPASGWEKGSIESTISHLKADIRETIALGNLHFKDLPAFQEMVRAIVESINARGELEKRFAEEGLRPLPDAPFPAYESVLVTIDKFSTFSPLKNGHRYSAPSYLVGLSVEARVYTSRVELIYNTQIVAAHPRLWGKAGKTSIHLVHVIKELCKKPGVVPEWKHRQVLFSHPIWNKFYEKLKSQPSSAPMALREYLKSLRHMTEFGTENVTAAMELCLETKDEVSANQIKEVLATQSFTNVLDIKPIRRNLARYDELFNINRKKEL